MEKSKKILQLNRRLTHRPQPNDIQHDDELPNDLKKADSEYYNHTNIDLLQKRIWHVYIYIYIVYISCFVCICVCFVLYQIHLNIYRIC